MPLLSERSEVFKNADPHAVSCYVNQHVGSHCIQLPRKADAHARLNHRKFASLDLCRISYGSSVRVVSHALEDIFHLQVLLRGDCLWRGPAGVHHLVPGELLLINPDDPVDLTYSQDCEKFILKVPTQLLESICQEQRWLYPREGIRFLQQRYSLDQLKTFVPLLATLCTEAEDGEALLRVQEHYAQIVASKMLTLMRNNVRREHLACSNSTFERLVDYIARNLQQDISVQSLAEQAQLSVRSLYSLFEKHMSTTPQRFIREQKLSRVHACLADPSCNVRNVTELALDYGFVHLGRFAEQYRRQFSELPSDTLKQRGLALSVI
ncbi:AraC family transcriptional regulator [Pseudomonas spelaei]|nr:AraC family transcriptional regulator [Pseudomonas spelaei]